VNSTQTIFKLPDGLDLEDETVVLQWRVKWGILYIKYVNGEEQEIEFEYEDDDGCKHPEVEIADAAEHNVEYEEDN
jgi:hypothetical protein